MPTNNANNQATNKAIEKYQVAVNKNISESEILWNRYNALLVFNSLLLTSIGFVYGNKFEFPSIILKSLPVFGLITCYLWFITTFRGFQWIKFWITSARKIEDKYLKDKTSDELDPIINGKNYREFITGWPHTQLASYLLIFVTCILYLLILFSGLLP